jgi:hypothetical protein
MKGGVFMHTEEKSVGSMFSVLGGWFFSVFGLIVSTALLPVNLVLSLFTGNVIGLFGSVNLDDLNL